MFHVSIVQMVTPLDLEPDMSQPDPEPLSETELWMAINEDIRQDINN